MKNKPLLIAIIYSVLYIGVTLYFFFTQRFEYFNMVYVMGMAALFPLCVLTIKIQRDTVYKGVISGREAAREGVKFVLFCAVFLVIFQVIFFYSGWRDFRIESVPGYYRAAFDKFSIEDKIKFLEKSTLKTAANMTHEQVLKQCETIVQKNIELEIANVTIFKEVTAVFFRIIFAGLFSSFLAALFLKRR